MQKKYIVRLSESEWNALGGLISKLRVSGQKVLRARALLKADVDGPCWRDAAIPRAFDCRTKTVENIRERFLPEGFEIAVNGKPKSRVRGKALSGDQEAKIIPLRLSRNAESFSQFFPRHRHGQT
jgi:hypothetical protein